MYVWLKELSFQLEFCKPLKVSIYILIIWDKWDAFSANPWLLLYQAGHILFWAYTYKFVGLRLLIVSKINSEVHINKIVQHIPVQLTNHSTALAVLNALLTKRPERQLQMIDENKCSIRRTGKTKFYDLSRRRAGRQAIGNCLNDIFDHLYDNWKKLHPKMLYST